MEKRLLVIAAHPDDEVLGCGATVALKVKQGWQANLIILSGGVGGRYHSSAVQDGEVGAAVDLLRQESERATKTIGFTQVVRHEFPDNRFDTVGRMDIAQAILAELKKFRPNLLLLHHPGDYNWDHTIAFEAALMAARSSPGEYAPQEILAYEVPSSSERSWQNNQYVFQPNVFVNIAKTIDKKKLALQYYESEYRPYPHPRSIEGIEYWARKRGLEVGIPYAEAFELIRRIEE